MAVTVTINGFARTPREGTLQVEASYGSRHLCRMEIVDLAGALSFAHDQVVTVVDGATTIFGGILDEIGRVSAFAAALTAVKHTLLAVDYRARCDQRVVTETYAAGLTLKQVLTDLHTNYLSVAGWGITMDPAQADGPPLAAEITWTNVTLVEALNYLQSVTGWLWTISYAKVFGAYDPSSLPGAPFSVTTVSRNATSVSVTQPRVSFRNRQVLVYGSTSSVVLQDAWTSTVGQTAFALHYAGPTAYWVVTEGGIYYPVGVTGVDAMQWTYDAATNALTRTGGIGAGVSVLFQIQVPFPQSVVVEDVSATANPWESVNEAPDIYDYPAAVETATALLRRFYAATIPQQIRVVTETVGLMPGQALTVTLPGLGLAGAYFVTSVRGVHKPGSSGTMVYTADAVEGEELPESFQEMWRSMSGATSTSGGVIVSASSTTSSGSFHAHLGGSRQQYGDSGAWAPIPEYVTFVCPVTGIYTLRTERQTFAAGTTVQVRLYDVTASAAAVTGTATAAVVWEEEILSVSLTAGHRYRVEMIGSDTAAGVQVGQSTVEL